MGVKNCRRSGVACAMLLLAVAACDGGEESVATTEVITVAPTSTVATTSTTTVVTTTPTTTEVSPTVSPTTAPVDTTAATTAEGDEEAAKAAVIAAAIEAKEAWWAVRQNPSDPEALDRLQRAYTGAGETFVVEHVAKMIAAGERTVSSTELEPLFVVFPDAVSVDRVTGTAMVRACEHNPWVLVLDSGSGEITVLDDSVWTYIETFELALVEGSWQAVGSSVESQHEGFQSCDGL
jgi:hypothetical protein